MAAQSNHTVWTARNRAGIIQQRGVRNRVDDMQRLDRPADTPPRSKRSEPRREKSRAGNKQGKPGS